MFWYLLVMNFLYWFIDGGLFEIFRISIKATHQETLDFYTFHCSNISKHISISVLFFIISVSCFVGSFCYIFKNNFPRDGVLARFICPRGWNFALSLCPGVGNSSFQKIPWGFAQGGGQAWN